MLRLKYDPVYGTDYSYLDDYRYTPDYRYRRPIDYYFNWPWAYRSWFLSQRYRRNLYKLLRLRELTYFA
ncbi:hypothetical protein GWI33_001170 [Rhynchophorus ferrugineus]|uniref:Uncharacterized protein n=1 Tax=Rhynchophorus ferrugineus TaxID=354439 RepID=A0A834IQI6_RHYFE|nr:hypothetical protein GWI33_001170 [Rhynchophorus ferrugineus]